MPGSVVWFGGGGGGTCPAAGRPPGEPVGELGAHARPTARSAVGKSASSQGLLHLMNVIAPTSSLLKHVGNIVRRNDARRAPEWNTTRRLVPRSSKRSNQQRPL